MKTRRAVNRPVTDAGEPAWRRASREAMLAKKGKDSIERLAPIKRLLSKLPPLDLS